MPTYEVELSDGRVFEVEADAPPTEQDVLTAIGGGLPPASAPQSTPGEQGSGGASATVGALRAAPKALQGAARFAANHPAGTQKVIGAGISTVAGGIGAGVGGVPGAVVGASIRGVTPAQAAIRTAAGRAAGEAPDVARTAGRAVGVANYGKEMGLAVKPEGLISTGNPARAFDAYADSNGLKAPRVLDQYGKVVYGPEVAQATRKAPGRLLTTAAKGAGAVGKALGAVAGPMGMTDFAQTVEPNRQDIGVMGIGKSVDVPGMHPTAFEQLRQAILQKLGY